LRMEYCEEGCRLCLTTDKSRSYYSLLNLEHLEILSQSFSLDSDLRDPTLHPKHVCDECNLVINRFVKLKKIATQNDKFVRKNQERVRGQGISEAVRTARNGGEERESNHKKVENNSENSVSEHLETNCSSVDDESKIKEEHVTRVKEEEEEIQHIMKDDSRFIKTMNISNNLEKVIEIEGEYHILNEIPFQDIIMNEEEDDVIDTADGDLLMETEVDEPVTFKCNQCSKVFRTANLLRGHLQTHNAKVVKCPICVKERFLKEHVLRKHLRNVHRLQKDIRCEYPACEKMFKLREVMKSHMKMVHLKDFTLCNICGDSVRNLSYHRETCNKDNVIKNECEVCAKKFSSKNSLETHRQTIHESALNECSICLKEVKNLTSHIKWIHSEGEMKTYPCTSPGCEEIFKSKPIAVRHLKRVHEGEKDQCPICSEWLKNLPSHLRQVHKMGKKHMCDECGKVFYKGCDLKVHIEKVHEGKKHICPKCGKTIVKIKDHMNNIHGVSDVNSIETIKCENDTTL